MTIEEAIRAALIAEYDAIPPKEELEKMYTFSERHERQMAELFANLDKFDAKCRRRNLVRKIAIILVVVLAVTVVSVKFVPEVYAFVKEWLMELADDESIEFRGKSSDNRGVKGEELRFELGYVPDGYELVSEEEYTTGTNKVMYRNEDGSTIKLEYKTAGDIRLFAINIEDAIVEEINIDNNCYRLFECLGRGNVVFWEKDGYIISIEGVFEKSQMLNMATSVTVKK
ncbi:MAG: DUF4367 domain-containing protein [Lachnospiraceae bacterium]|nr:DUF4367 domain-containing protein [Lachnospiraceae bacterium]